ncbi:hypothetical protein K469DRAFT_183507 [Zopfia rhizophila CBS 207.26]|uniref:Uncharacterized protein n=1 Tax=Zopfia rhizophila CBS 207.26 TaxID=1314779 RepID=A0A6A6E1F0_9PEZI|nr:hypothetical protein K469DRAFT_183507 [Zopfia rhizophila CBS 207.26]
MLELRMKSPPHATMSSKSPKKHRLFMIGITATTISSLTLRTMSYPKLVLDEAWSSRTISGFGSDKCQLLLRHYISTGTY